MNNNNMIMTITFDPLITMSLIARREIRAVIEAAIKAAIEEAETNHRVYKLDELLAELDDDEN